MRASTCQSTKPARTRAWRPGASPYLQPFFFNRRPLAAVHGAGPRRWFLVGRRGCRPLDESPPPAGVGPPKAPGPSPPLPSTRCSQSTQPRTLRRAGRFHETAAAGRVHPLPRHMPLSLPSDGVLGYIYRACDARCGGRRSTARAPAHFPQAGGHATRHTHAAAARLRYHVHA